MPVTTDHRPPPRETITLALETATPVCGVALLRGGDLLLDLSFVPAAGHSASLMQAVDAASRLGEAPREAWTGVAVSSGPGSFTGLRIGMATGKALALALGVPLYGVPTLAALAARLEGLVDGPVCAALDARKGQVFAALFRPARGGFRLVRGPVALAPADLPSLAPRDALFTGDAFDRHGEGIRRAYRRRVAWAPPDLRFPSAAAVGRLALARVRCSAPTESVSLVPEYVRPSDAELNHGRPRGR